MYVTRFPRTQKKIVTVSQPHCMYAYKTGMRRVDQRKKCNFPLIAHLVDVAEQNKQWKTGPSRIVLALLETNKRVRGKKRSRPLSFENMDSQFDRLDHLVISREKTGKVQGVPQESINKMSKV
ncbi:hypothetical protein PR048_007723 [Dryococelus australis]|uniref:Uncharacterized protein n=1 Tax=Dryococelus australis TaxID=614101 RepID=A0ABQ9HV48_9NEOP|nr:hypothetical protein PR048_007723 [Dryococelus australis]